MRTSPLTSQSPVWEEKLIACEIIMERGRHMFTHNNDNKDRLSDLPNCVLLHILSFLYAKQAVQTCILSTRWKHLWKHLPTFTSSSSNFRTVEGFSEFAHRFLTVRDGSTALCRVDIFANRSAIDPGEIVEYAVSHNVQRLRLNVTCDIKHILPCIFSSHTLTSLSLSAQPRTYPGTLFPNSLNLPALTSLHLQFFVFRGGGVGVDGRAAAEPFSAFSRLNSLMIDHCNVRDAKNLCISSTTLVNLTIHGGYRPEDYDYCKIELSAPNLSTFAFIGTPFQKLCWSHVRSVKHVNIDADLVSTDYFNASMASDYTEPPWVLLSWLQQLANVESLTVSATTLQVLSLVPDLSKLKLASLRNLKLLKVNKNWLSYGLTMILRDAKVRQAVLMSPMEYGLFEIKSQKGLKPSSSIPDGIVDFLLQNSPSANVDIIKDQFDLASSIKDPKYWKKLVCTSCITC